MPSPNCSAILVVLISLPLSAAAAVADEEIATKADLALLASRQDELEAKFEVHQRAQVDAIIESRVGRALAARTTELLHRQIRLAARQGNAPPASPRPFADDRPTNQRPASNTTCTMVGRTLECVLRDSAVP
jgi:hypothetical protein